MDIGIFSGSFNPVHIGHLALANYLCEFEGLEEVWFMVSPRNPLKETEMLMNDSLRLELVRLAVEGYPKFRASDFEFRLPRPSYTAHTLDELRRAYPAYTFHLIVGADNWLLFSRWHDSDRILATTPLIVYPRPGYPVAPRTLPPTAKMTPAPTFEISSTFIRQAIAEGRDIRYFLHPRVYEALCKNGIRTTR